MEKCYLGEIKDLLEEPTVFTRMVESEDNKLITSYISSLQGKLKQNANWNSFKTFWPPRLIKAYCDNKVLCFFGAGISMPCGLPSWDLLLSNYLELDKVYVNDTDLKNDPLTLAEIASHNIGTEKVQKILRDSFAKASLPSISHYLLCCLRANVYVTTNYDSLFEEAWEKINPSIELKIIVNNSDLEQFENTPDKENFSVLYKIHGSADRSDEQMILTRSEYRRHYRYNSVFFDKIKAELSNKHVLFLGFSHSDPEVTRLVEDVIWKHESDKSQEQSQPNFYSLQFNMKSHTPEIFASKGIVALNPPMTESKTEGLCQSVCDFIGASHIDFHKDYALDEYLKKAIDELRKEISKGLEDLKSYSENAINYLEGKDSNDQWLNELQEKLGTLAGQGVYLLNASGKIKTLTVPEGLNKEERLSSVKGEFRERSYFRQAKTYRKAFVADSLESVYNNFSTVFFCCPLFDKNFKGLLFSACQVGVWEKLIDISKEIYAKGFSFICVDSNGICLLPPNMEFEIQFNKGLEDKEEETRNRGYLYGDLLRLSRKDKLVYRIMENIVPIAQDDDVLSLSADLKFYSVISGLSGTLWKIAIARPIYLSKE